MAHQSRKDEVKLYGWRSSLAVFQQRPGDIIRVYVAQKRLKEVGDLLKYCAQNKVAYHVLTDEELDKVTHSHHHEGLAIIARKRSAPDVDQWLKVADKARSPQLFVFLDQVSNPHNIGAMMRTAAHFGVKTIFYSDPQLKNLSPSAMRIAEGGCEFVDLCYVEDPDSLFRALLSMDTTIWACDLNDQAESVFDAKLWLPSRNHMIVMGGERDGISARLQKLCPRTLVIPGTGHVQSLNVSVAFAVVLSCYAAHK